MRRFTVDPTVPLTGTIDYEARLAGFPREYSMRGLFFPRLLGALGADWNTLQRSLYQPPLGGRYAPLALYPQVDYARIACLTALRLYPALSLFEGLRRIARDDLATFRATPLGQTFAALFDDPIVLFTTYPVIYPFVMDCFHPRAIAIEGGMRIEMPGYLGIPEYSLGTFEGFVLACGHSPTVTVESRDDFFTAYDVRWT